MAISKDQFSARCSPLAIANYNIVEHLSNQDNQQSEGEEPSHCCSQPPSKEVSVIHCVRIFLTMQAEIK